MRVTTLFLLVSFLLACSGGGGGGSSLAVDDISTAAITDADSSPTPSIVTVDDEGVTSILPADLISQLEFIPLAEVNETEALEMAYMREEEKLAHDLYVQFYLQWGLRAFTNIADAELTHTSAVLALLERYEIADPASTEPGVFNNLDLQNLYDYLLASGSPSIIDALLAACTVEEVDILDLEAYLLDVDGNDDIVLVYENLLAGSHNHLRAFVNNLEKQGITYAPTHLTQEAYDAIIES